MPAKSEKQRKAAGMALAAKRGRISKRKLKGTALKMYMTMTEEQLEHYAHGKKK